MAMTVTSHVPLTVKTRLVTYEMGHVLHVTPDGQGISVIPVIPIMILSFTRKLVFVLCVINHFYVRLRKVLYHLFQQALLYYSI